MGASRQSVTLRRTLDLDWDLLFLWSKGQSPPPLSERRSWSEDPGSRSGVRAVAAWTHLSPARCLSCATSPIHAGFKPVRHRICASPWVTNCSTWKRWRAPTALTATRPGAIPQRHSVSATPSVWSFSAVAPAFDLSRDSRLTRST